MSIPHLPISTAPPASVGSQNMPVGVGLAGDISDQFVGLINQWNEARLLSKPVAVRAMMLMRQKGQGGEFLTEALALEARIAAAAQLSPLDFDLLIDVYHAGLNAYETLVLRSQNPFAGAANPMPDLSHPFAPASDLGSSRDQPFSEWIAELSPLGDNGVGSKWHPNSDDKRSVGDTWTGLAKRTSTSGTYKKARTLPWGVIQDRWVRVA